MLRYLLDTDICSYAIKRKEAALLGIGTGAACLDLDRTTWRAGRVVTHVRQLFRGDRFDLVAEFNAGP